MERINKWKMQSLKNLWWKCWLSAQWLAGKQLNQEQQLDRQEAVSFLKKGGFTGAVRTFENVCLCVYLSVCLCLLKNCIKV